MKDTIYRQEAIDAIVAWTVEDRPDVEMPTDLIDRLRRLPSAQPEIIRCKDCRWGKEVCGNIECFAGTNVPPEYHGYEWFCPNGKRRTK